MATIKPARLGIMLAAFFALAHFGWSLLVLVGWAQPLLNFIFMLHMITPPYTVEAFDMVRALGLIVITALIGYLVGFVLAVLWNKFVTKA